MSGGGGPGANPEQFFAAEYAACFQSAFGRAGPPPEGRYQPFGSDRHSRQLGDVWRGAGVQSVEAFVEEALSLIAAGIAAFEERAR